MTFITVFLSEMKGGDERVVKLHKLLLFFFEKSTFLKAKCRKKVKM